MSLYIILSGNKEPMMENSLYNDRIFIQMKIEKLVNEIYQSIDFEKEAKDLPVNYDQAKDEVVNIFKFLEIFASENAQNRIGNILRLERLKEILEGQYAKEVEGMDIYHQLE